MTVPARRRWRLLRRRAWYTLAGLLLLLALGNGIGSQLLQLAERHPQAIAEWLSHRAQRKVVFDHVETRWTRRGPLLRLDNLRIGDAGDALRIGDAEILVAQYAGLLPGHSFTELRLRGLELTLQRAEDGTWHVRGLPGQQQAQGDPLAALERLGELQVARASLHVLAPALGIDLHLPRIDLRFQVNGARVRAGARAWLQEAAAPFAVAAEFDRRSGDGRIYAGARQLNLQEVAGSFSVVGITPVSGRGRLQAWAQLRGHRVVAVHAVAGLLGVSLREAGNGKHAASSNLGEVVLDAGWSGDVLDWRLQVPRLRIGDGTQRQVLDGLSLQGGHQFGVQAPRLRLGPLLQVAALSKRVPAGLRGWLRQAKPDVHVRDLRLRKPANGTLRASARVDGFTFAANGNAPGLQGVSGWLQADADGVRLRFDPQAQVTFAWPAGFGVDHRFTLDGEAVLWQDGSGNAAEWAVHTPGLAINGDPLQVKVRGGIGFQGDGSRPRLDLAADIGDVPVTLAHGFWIHYLMPAATVSWLDAALQGGRLHNTRAVVAGDLDDWPFRDVPGMAGAGVFHARTHIENGRVKFQPDWPAAEAMNADVQFVADGFSVNGSARIAGVQVPQLSAGIAHFGEAELQVDARTRGDAANFLSLLKASPLHQPYGEVMDNLQAAGPVQAEFHMRLPLHHDQPMPPQIDGKVNLAGARLGETRWKLDFEQVRGQAQYDQDGFAAEGLQVLHDGAAGSLSLRAGPYVHDPKQVFEAELQASLAIDELLDKAGNLAWLKPHMQGSSPWTLALAVPQSSGQTSAPARLRLQSSLVGTAIHLPQPLTKPAASALPASVALQLPLEQGEVEVSLGKLLSLRSRSSANKTGVRIQLGGGRAEAAPAQGLAISGQVDRLDALDWIGVVAGSGDGATAIPLRRVELSATRMRLLGADFADAKLVLAPAAQGIAVQVKAPGIAGALLLPKQPKAAVAGHFQRLYWTPERSEPAPAAATPPTPPVAPMAGQGQTAAAAPRPSVSPAPALGFDPSGIPPLSFEVDDLRIGGTLLGVANLRTAPVVNGLRLEEFRTRGSKQRISANGSWIGRDAAAWSQLRLNVDSDDTGALLAGFGYPGQIRGGQGRLELDANWRGGPEALDPKRMQASLTLDVRDGQLLELEPGAGRVLGLLGFAQLPRRLMLDFSDFFGKGFAFDRMQGDVRLQGGNARTDNLAIKGPAADLHLRGSADLRNQRFDQTVEVLPNSGGLLTAVGALTAGPVGAAVGAVANAVLDKPMQSLGAKTYKITGPWEHPKVEVLARDKPKPEPAAAASQ